MNCYIDPVHPDHIGVEKPQISFGLPQTGTVRPRSIGEITSSNWLLGCETLDRDYADYDQYKEYLCPLGIHTIRLQGGWAKTERQRGVYDWQWLDHIVEDAISRGLRPWVQTSYGNSIYSLVSGLDGHLLVFNCSDYKPHFLKFLHRQEISQHEKPSCCFSTTASHVPKSNDLRYISF